MSWIRTYLGQDFEKFGPNRLSFFESLLDPILDFRPSTQACHHSQRRSCAGPRMPCSKLGRNLDSLYCEYGSGTLRTGNLFLRSSKPSAKTVRIRRSKHSAPSRPFWTWKKQLLRPLTSQPKVDEGHVEIVFLELGTGKNGFFQVEDPLPTPGNSNRSHLASSSARPISANPLRSYSSDKLSDLLPISLKIEIQSQNSYFPGRNRSVSQVAKESFGAS